MRGKATILSTDQKEATNACPECGGELLFHIHEPTRTMYKITCENCDYQAGKSDPPGGGLN